MDPVEKSSVSRLQRVQSSTWALRIRGTQTWAGPEQRPRKRKSQGYTDRATRRPRRLVRMVAEEKESGLHRQRATRRPCRLVRTLADSVLKEAGEDPVGGVSHEYPKFLADVLDASVRAVSGQKGRFLPGRSLPQPSSSVASGLHLRDSEQHRANFHFPSTA